MASELALAVIALGSFVAALSARELRSLAVAAFAARFVFCVIGVAFCRAFLERRERRFDRDRGDRPARDYHDRDRDEEVSTENMTSACGTYKQL